MRGQKNIRVSVSCTTRKPRPGEKEGVAYYFKTADEFKAMAARGEFLEYKEVFGNYYGTPKKQVEELLNNGFDVVLEIDVKGAYEVKKQVEDAVLIFFTPSSAAETERRLRGRGTETEEVIAGRLKKAEAELRAAKDYDYLVLSTTPEESAQNITAILKAEKCRTARNIQVIKNLVLTVDK